MAQSGYTPIQLYYSTTAAAVPVNTNLNNGELAINIQDEKLYFKNAAGTVKLLASNATSAPVTSFSAGSTGLTPSTATTGAVTLAGTLATTNGGTGLTSFTSGGVVYASSTSALATGSALTFDGTTPTSSNATGAVNFIFNSNANTPYIRFDQTGASKFTIGESSIVGGGGAGFYDFYAVAGVGQRFFTNAAERMRLTSAGSLVVGGTEVVTNNGGITATTTSSGSVQATLAMRNAGTGNGSGTTLAFRGVTNTGAENDYAYLSMVADNTTALTGSIRFSTANGAGAPVEAMRISNQGYVGIGTTSPNRLLSLYATQPVFQITNVASGNTQGTIQYQVSGSTDFILDNQGSGSGGNILFYQAGAERARLPSTGGFSVGTSAAPGSGAIYATGNITAYYSDARLKTVSGKIENALDKVAKLSGVYYTNNSVAKSFGYDSDEVQVGVLAQDVEAVLPQIVKAAPFDLDADGNSKSGENYKTVQYEKLVPLLIEAINELQAKVKALEAK